MLLLQHVLCQCDVFRRDLLLPKDSGQKASQEVGYLQLQWLVGVWKDPVDQES